MFDKPPDLVDPARFPTSWSFLGGQPALEGSLWHELLSLIGQESSFELGQTVGIKILENNQTNAKTYQKMKRSICILILIPNKIKEINEIQTW
jgi:hypothetical protein